MIFIGVKNTDGYHHPLYSKALTKWITLREERSHVKQHKGRRIKELLSGRRVSNKNVTTTDSPGTIIAVQRFPAINYLRPRRSTLYTALAPFVRLLVQPSTQG